MISSEIYLERMLSIAREAGGIALDLMGKSDPGLKKDHSIITLADKAISKLARAKLSDFLQDPQHILIDEEDPGIVEYLDQKRLDQSPFIWALDPIDGTRLYANRMPLFGISIGLIKDLKPGWVLCIFPCSMSFFIVTALRLILCRMLLAPMRLKPGSFLWMKNYPPVPYFFAMTLFLINFIGMIRIFIS